MLYFRTKKYPTVWCLESQINQGVKNSRNMGIAAVVQIFIQKWYTVTLIFFRLLNRNRCVQQSRSQLQICILHVSNVILRLIFFDRLTAAPAILFNEALLAETHLGCDGGVGEDAAFSSFRTLRVTSAVGSHGQQHIDQVSNISTQQFYLQPWDGGISCISEVPFSWKVTFPINYTLCKKFYLSYV